MLTDGQTDRRTEGETFANLKLLSELKSFAHAMLAKDHQTHVDGQTDGWTEKF